MLSMAPLLASAEGAGLTNVDFGLFLWTFVLFALFAVVLGRFGWKPLLTIIEGREKSVREALEGAQSASAEAQALLTQHQELLRNTGKEREEILARAIKEAELVRADLVAKAKAEADAQLERARTEIQRETKQALLEVRSHLAELVFEATSRVVASSLSQDTQQRLVDEFIRDLPPIQ
jgi:F-type H+-transporting ATPase subunit b